MDGTTIALLATGGVIGQVVASVCLSHRRVVEASRSHFDAAMTLMCITLADVDDSGREAELQNARSHCDRCGISSQCRKSLARPLTPALPAACPNSQLLDTLTRHHFVPPERPPRPRADLEVLLAHTAPWRSPQRHHWTVG